AVPPRERARGSHDALRRPEAVRRAASIKPSMARFRSRKSIRFEGKTAGRWRFGLGSAYQWSVLPTTRELGRDDCPALHSMQSRFQLHLNERVVALRTLRESDGQFGLVFKKSTI